MFKCELNHFTMVISRFSILNFKGLLLLVLLFSCNALIGQDSLNVKPQSYVFEKKTHFRLSPFFWFVGFKGEIYTPPVPSNYPNLEPKYEIDVGFKEIASDLKFALMLSGEHYEDKWSARFDMSSIILDGNAITPLDAIFTNINYRLGYLGGNISAGLNMFNESKFRLDLMAGAKFTYMSIEATYDVLSTAPIEENRDEWWLDPTLGLNLVMKPFDRTEFKLYADIGAIAGVELSSQFITEFNYFVSKTFYLSIGYRYWYIRIPEEKAIYNGSIDGWIMRFGFQF